MRRIASLATLGVLVLVVVAQILLPGIVSGKVEDRLTAHGGSADVELSAFPAARLLFTEGDSARVRARGVQLELVSPDSKVFEQLDGFNDVDVRVTDAQAGPFKLASVSLQRHGGDRPYRTSVHGTITARDLGTFGASQVGGPLGGFLGGLMGGALPFGDEPVPVDLDAVIRSDGGRPRAVTVSGSVAGLPAGPLVEALAQALAGRF
jgi:hypothetical protein